MLRCALRLGRSVTYVFVVLFVGIHSQAQTHLQKYSLQKLSFAFRSSNTKKDRCLTWQALPPDRKHSLEYDDSGNPYLRVKITAQVSGECAVSFHPEGVIKEISKTDDEIIYEATFKPPVAIVYVQGPKFKDELVFEAPISKMDSVNFFEFFKRSKVQFELRYASISTNNPGQEISASMFPIVGGNIGVPFPWVDHLAALFSMYQNIGNFAASGPVAVAYSEFAFGLKYSFIGRERWGRPEFSPVFDFRGRNLYQTDMAITQHPFVVGSLVLPGFGMDVSWYPGAWLDSSFNSTSSSGRWFSKLGLDFSFRYYLGTKVQTDATAKSMLYDIGLNYRLNKKWALGGGFARSTQDVVFDSGVTVREAVNHFLVRLTLLPVVDEGGAK